MRVCFYKVLRQEKQLRATQVRSLGAELEGKEKSLKTLSEVNPHSHLDFLFKLGLVRKKEKLSEPTSVL